MDNKPGTKALEAMKDLKKSVVIFKKPELIVPKRKEKMNILTEEKYISELGKIIQKDFFPDLVKLRAQNEYLDAVQNNDVIKLRELYAKYSGNKPQLPSGFESPATFETPKINNPNETPHPQSTRSSSSSIKTNQTDKGPSTYNLDVFLSNYTSEDNNSFQEIIENADKKLQQKFSVLYNAEKRSAIEMAEVLALPSIEEQFSKMDKPKTLDTWGYKNRNHIMFVPDGVELTKEEQLDLASRKQEIVYNNTRLTHNPFDESRSKEAISEIAKSQAKVLTGKIGVDGNSLATGATPNIRGFSFVKTPSPCPGVAESPLMTWGEIEGTPFRLDGSDTPIKPQNGQAFRITEVSRRENIALELAEKAGERMRDQKLKAIRAAQRNMASPHIRSTFDRIATMSPAAKRLASGQLKLKESILTPNSRKSTISLLTPKSIRKAVESPLILSTRGKLKTKTPKLSEQIPLNPIITDDLLKIPTKRIKAADFF